MRALMKPNYQIHRRFDFFAALPRGTNDVGYSTR